MIKEMSILIIYTGGTIGMMVDPENDSLTPLDFNEIKKHLPELKKFDFTIDAISFNPPLDSSNIGPDTWIEIATIIEDKYKQYDGFVILHGTDTMAYTASALSFMFENLTKPIILTGSQIPIGILRTDGKENIISALEIASSQNDGKPTVPEVCIYFENKLLRGNRTHKHNAEYFNAFRSDNFPPLAEAGIHINYSFPIILKPDYSKPVKVYKNFDTNIAILKIFPGINQDVVKSILNTENLKGIVLESFGEGNVFTYKWFTDQLKQAIDKGLIILNVTQCYAGKVDLGKYETSNELSKIGILSGYDITTEAAVSKMMYLFGSGYSGKEIKKLINKPLRGEMEL